MASVPFFVRFVAILLLAFSIVYCDLVGHGKHELVNGKIVKLRGNTKIAEKPEDLELYKNMPGSCDVEMDKDGHMLAFSFSLKNGEFDGVKRGYPERHKNYCGDVLKCNNKGGKCLDVADYTVGWARIGEYIRSIIHPIGEPELQLVESSCTPITKHKHEAVVLYYFDGIENVRKPEKWKITDEDYTETLYNHLFTFHILPTTSMQMSMQNIWIKCNEDADKENCNENAAFQQCDKMFVKFPRYLFNMLVPDNSVKQTTTEETTTMATCPPVVDCTAAGNCPDVAECPPCTVGFPNAVTNIIQSGNSTKIVEIKPQNGSSLPGVPSFTKPSTNDCHNEETKKDSKKTLIITLASNVHCPSHLSIRQQKQIKGKDSELLDIYMGIVVIFVI
uniref:Uncharacterized protein n=1 Tax=Meloidogyne javanica TaxID=6303 RepID=A0A915MA04_MELJA